MWGSAGMWYLSYMTWVDSLSMASNAEKQKNFKLFFSIYVFSRSTQVGSTKLTCIWDHTQVLISSMSPMMSFGVSEAWMQLQSGSTKLAWNYYSSCWADINSRHAKNHVLSCMQRRRPGNCIMLLFLQRLFALSVLLMFQKEHWVCHIQASRRQAQPLASPATSLLTAVPGLISVSTRTASNLFIFYFYLHIWLAQLQICNELGLRLLGHCLESCEGDVWRQ